jgi:hypothetical protein
MRYGDDMRNYTAFGKRIILPLAGLFTILICIFVDRGDGVNKTEAVANIEQRAAVYMQATQISPVPCNSMLNNPFATQEKCLSQTGQPQGTSTLNEDEEIDKEKQTYSKFISDLTLLMRRGDAEAMHKYLEYSAMCHSVAAMPGRSVSTCFFEKLSSFDGEFLDQAKKASLAGNARASLALAKWNMSKLNLMHSKAAAEDNEIFFSSVAYTDSIGSTKEYLRIADSGSNNREIENMKGLLAVYEKTAKGESTSVPISPEGSYNLAPFISPSQ